YWGYNTLAFFAPHPGYAAARDPRDVVTEFKAMVKALHAAGIEVLLDVVYNHTAEQGGDGPALSWRGLDNAGYYRLDDFGRDVDMTGCGNTLDTREPVVLDLVLDSLRYWVQEMHVDGFRFDLAVALARDKFHDYSPDHPFLTTLREDPVLGATKLIVEPWDVGMGGWRTGAFPAPYVEWNDRFRDDVRTFWLTDLGAAYGLQPGHGARDLATRMSGSQDLFGDRGPLASINFVAAHDGFTTADLTAYNEKHNEANGEGNRDGASHNRSWNHTVEGPSDDPMVLELRRRSMRNLLATLLLSAGVPMITAGDEMGRTQQGNNNAYCQDSPLSWVNWHSLDEWGDQFELTRSLLALRQQHPVLRPTTFRTQDEVTDAAGVGLGRRETAWFHESGAEMGVEHWHEWGRRSLGWYVADADEGFYCFLHGGEEPLEVTLPAGPWGETYRIVAHTGEPGELPDDEITAGMAELAARAEPEAPSQIVSLIVTNFSWLIAYG
ncbi:MAG: glycogen debranching enzyme GlgX, partial [Propionibacteriaceae bacterium]|nr:glycogen debranching enzyme GlgX [Propionibacteriaceae bacterium]